MNTDATDPRSGKGVAIMHTMLASENFEQCVARLFQCVATAQRTKPGADRHLHLDIEGHRNLAGGYDADAFELINEFAIGFLLQYVTDIETPLYRIRNTEPQNDDVPDVLVVGSQPKQRPPVGPKPSRRSTPSLARIVEHLGLTEPMCLVCGSARVERVHVVPHALGGASELTNFALLCPAHHREAPDVADPAAFWSWVDAAYSRWNDDLLTFSGEVMTDLVETYGWTTETFQAANEVFDAVRARWRELVDGETGTHFGVGRKPSTMAWAWDVAFTDVVGPRTRSC